MVEIWVKSLISFDYYVVHNIGKETQHLIWRAGAQLKLVLKKLNHFCYFVRGFLQSVKTHLQ